MYPNNNLLNLAMNSLNIQATQEKRSRIFATNQRAVATISKVGTSTIDTVVRNLQIKPNIHGESDSQPLQPLTQSESFEIDLNKITLPIQMGGGNLHDLIQRLCKQYHIEMDSNENMHRALFVPVVTALAGQHAKEDTDCDDVTKAEFVPVFSSTWTEKRVLAISFSLNGETGLRIDLMKVKGNMTCLGRESQASTALQAIEIPNQLAMQLQDEKPEVFTQLQKNACLVAFVEFDLIPPRLTHETWRGTVLGAEPTRGMTRGGSGEETTHGMSKGVSAYTVIGQGSHTQDHSQSTTETGTRRLTKISVYVVGAMVVNTNEQELSFEQANTVGKMMQMRAQELGSQYQACKVYTFSELNTDLNRYLQKNNVNTSYTDIFEHAMLHLASITENPRECHFNKSEKTPQYFFMDLGISQASVEKFVHNLKKRFGEDFCEFTPTFNQRNTYAVRFSLSAVRQQMGFIQQAMDSILSDPRNLLAYQKYARREPTPFESLGTTLNKIAQEADISLYKTDCAEIVLLKMFGCEEELHHARFRPGESYVGQMMDIDFFLDISEKAAKELVQKINQQFTHSNNSSSSSSNNNSTENAPARFVRSGARITDKGNVNLCEIVIDASLLCSKEFQALFKETLNNLLENCPLLIEQLRIQSGTQTKSSKDGAAILMNVAQHYQVSEQERQSPSATTHAKQSLALSLVTFSSILTAPPATRSARFAESDGVRRSIACLESTQSSRDNEAFKKGDKNLIKEVQKTLGLRK